MFAILLDIWEVISRKVVLVVCGKEFKNSWLNPFFFFLSKFKINLCKSIGYMTLFSNFQSKICILKDGCKNCSCSFGNSLRSAKLLSGKIRRSAKTIHQKWLDNKYISYRCRMPGFHFQLNLSIYDKSWNIYIYVCHCLQPEKTRHKVNDPKVDYSTDLGEGKVRHEPRPEPRWSMLLIGPLSAMWT